MSSAFDNGTLSVLVNAVVWIVGIVVFGRLGTFVATRYFALMKMELEEDAPPVSASPPRPQMRK